MLTSRLDIFFPQLFQGDYHVNLPVKVMEAADHRQPPIGVFIEKTFLVKLNAQTTSEDYTYSISPRPSVRS
jgi:hypothetical protein